MKQPSPPQYPGQERRRITRVPYRTSLDYAVGDKSGAGSVRDISSMGLFLEARGAFQVGDQVSMRFRFRHSKAGMAINGEIRHIAATGVGVRLDW